MSFTGWMILGLALGGGVTVALFVLCWHLAYKDGYDDGRDYEKQRAYLRSIRAAREDRGSRPPSPAAVPWYQTVPPRPAPSHLRVVTTAGDIAPVIVPEQGTRIPIRPQPGRTSGAGTVTMPALTDTGELRAATDEFIEGMQARAERDRQELLS